MPLLFKPKKYEATIASVRDESPRVKVFTIQLPDKNFTFAPGMNVVISLPGVLNEKGAPLKRVFSIASAPDSSGVIELCVAVKPAPSFSSELAKLKTGSKVLIEGPFGIFHLREPVPHKITFIAGGTGIAPLLSMIRHLLKKGEKKEMILLFGFRTADDFLYRKELEGYAANHPNFRLITAASGSNDWVHKGRVTDIIPQHIRDPDDGDIYICGPQQMIADSRKLLSGLGFADRHIIYEHW